jgi:hypothetical protein
MAGISVATASAILKEVYGPSTYEQVNNEVRALAHFQKSESAEWLGKVFVESLHTRRNYSTKAVAEGGLLPNAGQQSYAKLQIPDRYVYGTIEVTAQFMNEVRSKGAFVNGMEREMKGLVDDLKVECNRMIWGYGSGILALVNGDIGGAPTTTIPLKNPGGVAGTVNGARFIRPGMQVAFHDAVGSSAPLAVQNVVSIAADGSSMVIDVGLTNATAPPNGWITKGVSRNGVNQGSAGIEPMGLTGLVDDGTFVAVLFGLDRSVETTFKATVFPNVGALDETILHRGFDACDELSGQTPNWLACHHSLHREYIRLSQSDRRYTGDRLMRPDVGITGGGKKNELTFNGIDIEKERMCPYGFFFAIDDSELKRYVNEEGKWVDEDGAVLHRGAGETDSFKGTYRKFSNYGILRCNSSFVLSGVSVAVDVINPN